MLQEKTALVLSAGGMFGAYQAGAWRALSRYFKPGLVVGASAGALNGWAIAGGCDPEWLIRQWLEEDSANLLRWRPSLSPERCLFDAARFRDRVHLHWNTFQPRTAIAITAVEFWRMKLCVFRGDEIRPDHLLASTAIPGAFPLVRIGGVSYCDGGVLGALPLRVAAELGATRILAINVLDAHPAPFAGLAIRGFQRALGRRGAIPAGVRVLRLCPGRALGRLRDSIIWSKGNAARWAAQGEADAEQIKHAVLQMFERE
jgi:predicted acylesterase/phospholipase RssA